MKSLTQTLRSSTTKTKYSRTLNFDYCVLDSNALRIARCYVQLSALSLDEHGHPVEASEAVSITAGASHKEPLSHIFTRFTHPLSLKSRDWWVVFL